MRILLSILAVALTGCVAPAPAEGPPPPVTTGQALAQIACPQRIAEANAWVNYMPGVGRSPRDLHVDLRLVDSTDTAIVLKSTATTGEKLVLEIRTSPAAPIRGRLAYREPAPDPMYKTISIFCRGAEIHAIGHIEKVY